MVTTITDKEVGELWHEIYKAEIQGRSLHPFALYCRDLIRKLVEERTEYYLNRFHPGRTREQARVFALVDYDIPEEEYDRG